jgi:hypothetical protein
VKWGLLHTLRQKMMKPSGKHAPLLRPGRDLLLRLLLQRRVLPHHHQNLRKFQSYPTSVAKMLMTLLRVELLELHQHAGSHSISTKG